MQAEDEYAEQNPEEMEMEEEEEQEGEVRDRQTQTSYSQRSSYERGIVLCSRTFRSFREAVRIWVWQTGRKAIRETCCDRCVAVQAAWSPDCFWRLDGSFAPNRSTRL